MPTPIAGFRPSGVRALPGYSVFLLPWTAQTGKTNVGWATAQQSGAALGGGASIQGSAAQNNEIAWDVWLDQGTYKYAHIHNTSSDRGIYTVSLDGSSLGTIDGWASTGPNWNTYTEITGIAVAAPTAARNFKLKMATKNVSSTGYSSSVQSSSFIRTGA